MYTLRGKLNADKTISAFDGFGCPLAGTLAFCTRRSNQRNRIHGMALDIQAIPNRMLVQCAPAILCVVSDKGPFYQMKESGKLIENCRLLEEIVCKSPN